MNKFFYNLGRSTAKAQHLVVAGTGEAGTYVADAAKSFAQGYTDRRAEDKGRPSGLTLVDAIDPIGAVMGA